MAKAIEERMKRRREVIKEAKGFAIKAEEVMGPLTAILYGSYARGDFNLWSDVDILLIVDGELPRAPHKRLESVLSIIPPRFEVRIINLQELDRGLRRASNRLSLRDALILHDSLGLSERLRGVINQD